MSAVLAPAPSDSPTDSDLLAHAADLLPTVVGRPPVLACDVHTALLEAARRRGGGEDRYADLRQASRAVDRFLAYLADTGQVTPGMRASQALRGWLRGRELARVRWALAAAAHHLRRQPDRPHRRSR